MKINKELLENPDIYFMNVAIQLSKIYEGMTSPNPSVGAVVVKNYRIVGVGYHRGKGHPHAEFIALRESGDLAKNGTLYVTLEPHQFQGTTPPCTHEIIKHGIKRVVIGSIDPNPLVNGQGIKTLLENGIEVKVGVLEEEVKRINEKYFTFHQKKRPWISIKIAQTLDGYISLEEGKKTQITREKAKLLAHKLRGEHDAILIGAETLRIDNPILTPYRFFSLKYPKKLILSRTLDIPLNSKIFDSTTETIVITPRRDTPSEMPYTVWQVEDDSIESIIRKCYQMGIQSVLVEGGASVFSQFLKANLWDRLYLFVSRVFFSRGKKSLDLPINLEKQKIEDFIDVDENDFLIIMKNYQ